jgi:hypothetical protein
VLLHATSRASKEWPEQHWVALGEKLAAQHGLQLIIPWGNAAEQQRAERLAAAMPQAVVAPRMNLIEACGLLGHARAVIGVDTGLSHLANALNVPLVAIYTDTDPARPAWWKPLGDQSGQYRPVPDGGCGVSGLAGAQGHAMNWRRGLYSMLWWAATPLIRRYLKKRARKAPAYLQHWDERFGEAPAAGHRCDLDSCGIGGRNPCRLAADPGHSPALAGCAACCSPR